VQIFQQLKTIMSRNSNEPKILLDSDVVRHFINGRQILKLAAIFPKRFVMLDKVKDELCKSKQIASTVINFLSMTKVDVIDFPNQKNIILEYAILSKKFGEGESACMAVAKFQKQFIASSNLKDIKSFCETHGITYLTTMDILIQAINNNIMTENECNEFITEVKLKGSKLPCNTILEYRRLKGEKM
jgi:predicted nucleic acid-binding protein